MPSYLASRTFLVVHSFTCILVSGCLIPLASTVLNVSPRQNIFHEEPPAHSCGPLPGVTLRCMDVLAHNIGGSVLLAQPHSRMATHSAGYASLEKAFLPVSPLPSLMCCWVVSWVWERHGASLAADPSCVLSHSCGVSSKPAFLSHAWRWELSERSKHKTIVPSRAKDLSQSCLMGLQAGIPTLS